MRTASGLGLIAVGAILAFAVTAHPTYFNIQVAGWVIMLTGVAGLLIPRRGYGWLRRRMVLSRSPAGPVVGEIEESPLPPYVKINPNAVTAADERVGDSTATDVSTEAIDAEYGFGPNGMQPTEETVEEFRQE
ncbi:MAG TPA: hypothetical protein VGS19_04810 [Streptosporangiaceae bacterium]|nr:hypothetical protein [Streptosporangiaceae bacterium]